MTTRRADRIAIALVAIGLALRLFRLDDALWYDEIVTLVEYARRPLAAIVTTYDNQNQHVLYSVLARLSFDLFGESGMAVRLPAALLGAACIWALYRLGRRIADPNEALISAALLAVSSHHIWFSQDARGYTGLMLFSLLGTAALLHLLEDQATRWGWVWVYGVVMALSAYTHVTSVLVSAGHAVVVGLVWLSRRRGASPIGKRPVIALAVSGIVALALYGPILPKFVATTLGPTTAPTAAEWSSPSWFIGETIRRLAEGVPGGWLGLVMGSVVMAAGVVGYWRQSWAITGLLILPAAITVGVAVLVGHSLRPRFVFFSLGFVFLLAVRGTYLIAETLLRRRARAIATAVLALGTIALAGKITAAWGPKQDFAGAASFVDRTARPEDAVVTVDLAAYPYRNYFKRPWPEVKGIEQLQAIERSHQRTWLLYTFPISVAAVQPDIWNHLRRAYDTAAVFNGTVGDGAIVVMVSRPAAATGTPGPAPNQ